MQKYHFIEDYIMDMGATFLTWPPKQSQIKLARYDETIVQSMADQVNSGIPFTDKQATLALKLVTKYRKQWKKIGYDITDQIDNPRYKFPIRVIDRRKFVEVNGNRIDIRFPYDQNIISLIRSSQDVPGSMIFNKELKLWQAAITPPRVLWCGEFAIKNSFEISESFTKLFDSIIGQDIIRPRLCEKDGQLVLENASDSLVDYLEQNGGIVYNNLVKLLDLSGVCKYTVDPSLFTKVTTNQRIIDLLTAKQQTIVYTKSVPVSLVIEYIRLTGKKHIAIYDDNTLRISDKLRASLLPQELDNIKITCCTTTSFPKQVDLLLTSHTYMIGHKRQLICQQSDKIISFTHMVLSENE